MVRRLDIDDIWVLGRSNELPPRRPSILTVRWWSYFDYYFKINIRGRTPSVEADLISQQEVAHRGARDHLLDNIPEGNTSLKDEEEKLGLEDDPECTTLNSDYDDSPDAARKIYKKSAYHPKTSWKGTRKEDL